MQRGAQRQKHGQQWALELRLAAGSQKLWGREGTVTWRQGQVTLKDSASTHSFVFRQSKKSTSFKIPTVDRISPPNCPSDYHLDTISSFCCIFSCCSDNYPDKLNSRETGLTRVTISAYSTSLWGNSRPQELEAAHHIIQREEQRA